MNTIRNTFIEASKATVVEHIERPARPARYAPPPLPYSDGPLADWLMAMTGHSEVWQHQSQALTHLEAGRNVVLATATASGKTLPFQAYAIRQLLDDRNARVIAFYPQKALGSDQMMRWQRALEAAGLPATFVAEVTGDVSMAAREKALESARIILMTPDVAHCYLLRLCKTPAVQQILAQLRFVVIDEAHTYDRVFGTSTAFFLRRLQLCVLVARKAVGMSAKPLQFMAATATIANPAEHLQALTSQPFVAITEDDNGAPCHGTTLMHIEGPDHGQVAERTLADILSNLASTLAPNAAIAFADGRQLVERVTRRIDRDDALPYRSGYEASDRRGIEQALRNGDLRVVVSTSALELGVDLPQFTVGINLGIPVTRKALQQRAGRVGRSQQAVFAVIAPALAFTKLGTSFAEFMNGSSEEAHLYLKNHIIQFQHARCLLEELGDFEKAMTLPGAPSWPEGFAKALEWAQPGAIRPNDLDNVASSGADDPHFAYSLRHLQSGECILRDIANPTGSIGKIEVEKALREAYPGATYRHFKTAYIVKEWRHTAYERLILLQRVKHATDTRPASRIKVTGSLNQDAIIAKRLMTAERGAIAEIEMRVLESVEGRFLGNTLQLYRDLSVQDRRLSRKHREFSTTGVMLRICEPWFQGDGERARATRRQLGEALVKVLCRHHSLAASDINFASTNVFLLGADGSRRIEDGLAIFDAVPGGLRLTSPLFTDLGKLLKRLADAANVVGEEALIPSALAARVLSWLEGLKPSLGAVHNLVAANDGDRLVYAPETEVMVRYRGDLQSRVLLQPEIINFDGEEQLMYRYRVEGGGSGLIAESAIATPAGEFRQMLWNPASGAMKELAA